MALLSELIRIDLKGRADPRQIRNIDLNKRVFGDKAMSLDEQLASAERSITSASKHKMFGAFPKTLVNLCKSIKASRPNQDRLIEVTLEALIGLDNESLLKIGPDLANLCALAMEKHSDASIYPNLIRTIFSRVGVLDNDLVVLALKDSGDLLIQTPQLFKQLMFDLVKFYFKA